MKTWFKRALALLLTAGLLAWFVEGGHWQGVLAQAARLPLPVLLGALAAFALSYGLRAGRVWDEFRRDARRRLPFAGVLRLTLLHNAMINLLPFRSGEAAFPLLLNRWYGVPAARAIAALLWLRIQDAFVVMALAAWVLPGLPLWLRLGWMAGIAALAWAIPAWARAHPEVLQAGGRFRQVAHKLRTALAESTRGSHRSWAWTAANWSIKLAAQAWLLAALLAAPFMAGLAGAMGVEIAAIQPVQGVAGFGTYEAGGAALMATHGIMLTHGLQAALTLHLFVIACSLAGGALAALLSVLKPDSRPAPL